MHPSVVVAGLIVFVVGVGVFSAGATNALTLSAVDILSCGSSGQFWSYAYGQAFTLTTPCGNASIPSSGGAVGYTVGWNQYSVPPSVSGVSFGCFLVTGLGSYSGTYNLGNPTIWLNLPAGATSDSALLNPYYTNTPSTTSCANAVTLPVGSSSSTTSTMSTATTSMTTTTTTTTSALSYKIVDYSGQVNVAAGTNLASAESQAQALSNSDQETMYLYSVQGVVNTLVATYTPQSVTTVTVTSAQTTTVISATTSTETTTATLTAIATTTIYSVVQGNTTTVTATVTQTLASTVPPAHGKTLTEAAGASISFLGTIIASVGVVLKRKP